MPTKTSRTRTPAKKAAAPAAKRSTAGPARKSAPAAKQATRKGPAAKPNGAERAAPAKAAKPKLVRDSFTMPKAEYQVIDELKQRGTKLAHPLKKSELLRAGIKALAAMADADFLSAVRAVPSIKTGRPKSSKKAAEPAAAAAD